MSWSEDILERAAVSLPGVTAPLLTGELDRLMVDFLRRSRAWRLELVNVATTGLILDLSTLVLNARVVGAIGPITQGQSLIWPVSTGRFINATFGAGDTPRAYFTIAPSRTKLGFAPALTADITGLGVEVYLIHHPGGYAEIPEDICITYAEALVAGLAGRMMLQPKKPYTDDKLGVLRMAEYRMGVNEARHTANKGRTTAPEPWSFPLW